jgi:membrane carboxypeptidase/penicillin-binding protein
VGFSSSLVAGVWVGFDQPEKIREGASGSRMALPIWSDFMRRTARRLPATAFDVPSGMRDEELCSLSYRRPVEGCPTYVEYFKDGDQIPGRLCELHEGNLKQKARRALETVFGAIGRGIRDIFRR